MAVGRISKPSKVTLTNNGKSAVQISSVTANSPFKIVGRANTCSGDTIAPKKTCSFYVEFAPTSPSIFCDLNCAPYKATGSIDVNYDGANPSVALAGEGIVLNAPKSRSFPSVRAGSHGTPKKIVISNPSILMVTLGTGFGTVSLGGSDPGSFKITSDSCSGQPLPPKGACGIGVEFAPPGNANGTQSATLSIGYTYGGTNGGGDVSTSLAGKVK